MTRWDERIAAELAAIEAAGQWRSTRTFDAFGQVGDLDHAGVVSFGGNDYLGLSHHPAVIEAAVAAAHRWGTGSTAARLLVGTRPVHHDLEEALAAWKRTEAAVLFSTGFQANLGVLGSLGTAGTTILSDELNHASIIDGCRLAAAATRVFGHGDLDHLDALLAETTGPAIVVTDTVFSMDGDVADVSGFASVCARYDALLVLDEAHAVLGPDVDPDDVECDLVRVGTLSKTLGSLGGFVAASREVVDLLVNRARPFIFTTASTPPDAAAALAALGVLCSPEGDGLVERLRAAVHRLRSGHPSPIVPVVIGAEEDAMAAAASLLQRGLYVPAVRPPTVAAGSSRLRIALSAAHTDGQIDRLVVALRELGLS
jgi:8-amino-7-oxononanoate synthase